MYLGADRQLLLGEVVHFASRALHIAYCIIHNFQILQSKARPTLSDRFGKNINSYILLFKNKLISFMLRIGFKPKA